MNSKIVYGPKEELILPIKSLGQIFYNQLKGIDKKLVAFINAENTNEFLTYGNIFEFSKNLSTHLRSFGVKTNDVISLVADNSIYYYLPILAGFYLGASSHFVSPSYTLYELRHLFKISQSKYVFCSQSSLGKLKTIQKEFSIKKIIVLDGNYEGFAEDIINIHDLIYVTDFNNNNFELVTNFDTKENVAIMLNTSGTTGLPKIAMLTHESIQLTISKSLLDALSYRQPNPGICTVPLAHGYGFYLSIGSLLSSSKLIIMKKFKTELFFELIQNFQVKKLILVPTVISLMVNSSKTDQFNLSSLKEVYSATSPLSANLCKLVVKKFNLKHLYELYGTVECGIAFISKTNKFTSNFSEGQLFPGKLMKISSPNSGEALGVRQFGEICVKGALFKGYMNDEEKTRQSVDDEGFFHTGDAGYYDEKGQLYLTDRIKDIIKYKSYQFSPVEVEEVLLRHPAVQDAVVVGKPNRHAGELPTAFIVKKPGAKVDENEIINYVAKFFSEQKQLHGGVRFIENVPRNYIGKILRKNLKSSL